MWRFFLILKVNLFFFFIGIELNVKLVKYVSELVVLNYFFYRLLYGFYFYENLEVFFRL